MASQWLPWNGALRAYYRFYADDWGIVAHSVEAQLLQRLTRADLSDGAFPFATSREIDLGYATVRATRITYVGELGWELYVPAEFAVGVFELLTAAPAECLL